jgi:hypothetical protein
MLRIRTISVFIFLILATTTCFAEGLEFGGVYQYNSGGNTTFDSSGMAGITNKLTVHPFSMGGVNAGYNLKYASLFMEFLFGATTIDMGNVTLNPNVFIANIGLDIYPIAPPLKPVFMASISGLTYASSLVSTDGVNETDDMFCLGAGFRWDLPNHVFVKGLYRVSWHTIQGTDNAIFMQGPAITAGHLIKFKRNYF